MANERKDTLAMAIDVRLAELWAELFELRPEHLDMELLGWFLRAAYLIYLGIRTLADRTARAQAPAPRETRLGLIFRQGVLVNVTNPKTALFFFAFLPQFVNRNGVPIPEQIVVLGLTFAVLGLITDGTWAVAAGSAAGWVKGRSTVRSLQRWLTGCIFIGLGVATALVGSEKR